MTLNQITIPCIDYAESVAFYRALGLVQIVDAPPRYARFEGENGEGATLSLHAVDAATASAAAAGTVIYFDHESAEALDGHVRELEERGVSFDTAPTDQRWGWREARLTDPAGNVVCLMFAGENRRFPPWRI